MKQPDSAGTWLVKDRYGITCYVQVQANSASGIYCKELKMGGSIHCGFQDWNRTLEWSKIK